ncbi:TetR family transcriptional regulator [Luteitalea sp. TBR-22]|uniref:TetR/AcrR family transcriptional regulator n=1 Tax=Luteitalea sp. TBR-22 TaxID=2802971 RepID=UPI001AF18C12|nr:TetR/AcrR family transcriptional regulator [Luteitalea sp. TBR-22]BCS32658.1 TetR family transcriptional regulator [Luteitalea sp. TBR-22]
MARPKSEDRRKAILSATTALIAEQGLGAPTAEIAARAGIPHGSVFTYFETKAGLFNALYQELTTELTDAVVAAISPEADTRTQFEQLWSAWTRWGTSNPDKRRAQAQLNISDLVTTEIRDAAYAYAAPVFALIRRAGATGPLKDAPIRYAGALVSSCAATTIEFMLRDPKRARVLCRTGLETVWHALH